MDAFSDAELEVAARFLEATTQVIVANRRARQAAATRTRQPRAPRSAIL